MARAMVAEKGMIGRMRVYTEPSRVFPPAKRRVVERRVPVNQDAKMDEARRNGAVRGQDRGRRIARWLVRGPAWLIVAAVACVIGGPLRPVAYAQNANVDRAASEALTAYLKQNRLPLVGAQVMKDRAGGRQVVLYGFAASDAGKQDAEQKTVAYLVNHLGAPAPSVDDRIVVKPELANMTAPSQQEDAAPDQAAQAGQAAGGLSFDSLYDQIQRYGIKSPPGE